MDGFLNLLKPPGMTSSDAVLYVRKRLPRGTKIGHGGTLDPDACGVLPVCVGSAARLFDYIIDKEKVYLAEITLGIETDTQDSSGTPVCVKSAEGIGRDELIAVLPEFTGTILQTPPAFSAVKKNGRRLYALARNGEDTTVEPREARIHTLEYAGQIAPERHLLRITCGKGVYIRTLLHDIGRRLGCGAHMSMLIREAAGVFRIENAYTLDTILPESIGEKLLPLDLPLGRFTRVTVSAECEHAVRNGNPLRAEWLRSDAELHEGDTVRLYMEDTFIGMGEITQDGSARFRAMMLRREEQPCE